MDDISEAVEEHVAGALDRAREMLRRHGATEEEVEAVIALHERELTEEKREIL
jgi:hypothetical protein